MKTQFILSAVMSIVLACPALAAQISEKAGKLMAVLKSEASLFEKARACQQLGEIGNREAVPVLAALLTDEHLGAYARSGLEGIPDPSAAAALRNAVPKLQGSLQIGAINSLAALRDTQAVELLGPLAAEPNSGASKEALLALGSIASPPAIQILKTALTNGPDLIRPEAAAACLLAADRLRSENHLQDAQALYDLVRTARAPLACRVGATRGAILSRGTGRVPFLIEQLRSEELAIRHAALLTAREIPDDALATAFNAELAQAKPDLQKPLLLALADCHNRDSIAAVDALTQSPDQETRQTALAVLGNLGPEAAPALLAALQRNLKADERTTALTGLKTLKGAKVDDLLLNALHLAATPALRIDLIRLLAERSATGAGPALLRLAVGSDKEASLAALAALRLLAAPPELPGLIALVKTSQDRDLQEAAENALSGACIRPGLQRSACEAVLEELKEATQPAERNAWIRILTIAGYAPALPFIEKTVNDGNSEVAGNALEQLGRWPDPTPMPTLLQAMEAHPNPALKKRALAAAIDLAATAADEGQRPDQVVTEWLRRALASAPLLMEQRRILGLLGRLKTMESFQLLSSFLDHPDLRTEAAAGLVQIAPALAASVERSVLQGALETIALTVQNADLKRQASQAQKAILDQDKAIKLFDGKSLSGWEGNLQVWRVRDGLIVGGSMMGNPQNEFLATTRNFTNFMLRLEYKLVGTEGFVNSGVQFRSTRISNPPHEMRGYQADIGAGHSGCLYDESRRNNYLARCSDETIKRLEKPGDWNRYEVRCEGAHIQMWLNGEKTVDYAETDATVPQTGVIALQIHGGCKAEISFRNLTVREF